MTKPTIGFIGVGYMGHGMAKNIVENGYPLVTMAHRKRDAVEDLIARGATEAQSPKEIAEKAEIIHLCVTGSAQVEALIRGENGILAGLRAGAIVVDCSTMLRWISNPHWIAERSTTLSFDLVQVVTFGKSDELGCPRHAGRRRGRQLRPHVLHGAGVFLLQRFSGLRPL